MQSTMITTAIVRPAPPAAPAMAAIGKSNSSFKKKKKCYHLV